jgi:hypothetical protein
MTLRRRLGSEHLRFLPPDPIRHRAATLGFIHRPFSALSKPVNDRSRRLEQPPVKGDTR